MSDPTQDSRASSSSPQAGSKDVPNRPIETTDQLRIAIDHGHGKVNATDPAAAPLGTDDEAGGTSNKAAQVALAAAHEIRPQRDSSRTGGIGPAWWIIGIVVFIATGVLAATHWLLP